MIPEALATLTLVASALAGPQGATVVCDTSLQPQDWGFADVRGRIIYVRPDLCDALMDASDVNGAHASRLGQAALTLAHEAAHTRGIPDERQADCWALKHVPVIAELLNWSDTKTATVTRYARAWDQLAEHPCHSLTH